MDNTFFEESTEQSQAKARIVSKYFWAWASVMRQTVARGTSRILYLDLFSGPGKYVDGTKSTPLLVLEKAIDDPAIGQILVTQFNDKSKENAESLIAAIAGLPGIGKLKYRPQVSALEIGSEVVKIIAKAKLIPTFFFVDPWGYKGLSLELIQAVLKNWGCDCIFFFNYNRINPGLSNPKVKDHMDALFGRNRRLELCRRLETLGPRQREAEIVEQVAHALIDAGAKYVLPFTFKSANGERTSHHLFLATKHFRGYEIMKEIMARESSDATQGVPSFEYLPAEQQQPLLFELHRPLDDLEEMLLRGYAGCTMTVKEIYEQHSVGRPYIERNYKQALLNMEKSGKIRIAPPRGERRTRKNEPTLPDSVKVTFQKQGS
jgi:three-Cys-motif partner protein